MTDEFDDETTREEDEQDKKDFIQKYNDMNGDDVVIDRNLGTITVDGITHKIGWSPFPKNPELEFGTSSKSSQELFLESCLHFQEVLYHGTRGIGKTEALIASFVQFVGQGYGPSWQGVIFRKSFKSLRDVIRKSKAMIAGIFTDAKFFAAQSELKWRFADGEELVFDVLKDGKEGQAKYDEYHGQELAFIGFDELTRLKSLEVYHKMKSCLRVTNKSGKTPPKLVRATTNPDGPGKNEVRAYFIDHANEKGVTTEQFQIRGKTRTIERLHIRGSYLENPFIPDDYELELYQSCEGNPRRWREWAYGDWYQVSGGMFGDNFEPQTHILKPFPIPKGWEINRAMDWGTGTPFAVGWWAKTDGSGVWLNDEEFFAPPQGSLIMIGELYGCKPGKPNVGLNLTPSQFADKIKETDKMLYDSGILSKNHHKIETGPADHNMFHSRKMAGVESEASIVQKKGIKIKRAIKGNYSRAKGANLLNQYLFNTKIGSSSGRHIYIFNHCKYWIQNVPVLECKENDPDDIEEGGCDHDFDMTRYRIMENEMKVSTSGGLA